MGCLNSDGSFEHWFGNIHLSGPCNRSCYFCIGQYMPGQDMNNNLAGELEGLNEFILVCKEKGVTEVNLTGTNTDPLMRSGLIGLCLYLRMNGFNNIGIRTNGARIAVLEDVMPYIDKVSVSVTSFDSDLYKQTMGQGTPPDMTRICHVASLYNVDVKLNVVLCPEVPGTDLVNTIRIANKLGIKRINFREPYGQEHIGDPFAKDLIPNKMVFGNPCYFIGNVECTYWDVHYTEVESVNLYADGKISLDYPVTRGHSDEHGDVKDQSYFEQGRQRSQWVGTKMEVSA